jgi:hypothetical protein
VRAMARDVRIAHRRRDKVKVIRLVEKMSAASTFKRLLTKNYQTKQTRNDDAIKHLLNLSFEETR